METGSPPFTECTIPAPNPSRVTVRYGPSVGSCKVLSHNPGEDLPTARISTNIYGLNDPDGATPKTPHIALPGVQIYYPPHDDGTAPPKTRHRCGLYNANPQQGPNHCHVQTLLYLMNTAKVVAGYTEKSGVLQQIIR